MKKIENNITEKKQISVKKYGITFGFYFIFSFIFMWNDGVFESESLQEVIGSVTDGFFIAGILFAGIGGLSYIGSKGTYDTLSYGVSKIGIHQWVPGLPKEIPESFYEYKIKKEEKGRTWFCNLLLVGLAGIGLSVLFLILYLVV